MATLAEGETLDVSKLVENPHGLPVTYEIDESYSYSATVDEVWDIIPGDTQHRKMHFAPYPEELCVIPIKSTCPQNGVVLDPFSGTGTTMKVAYELGRKSIGIDLSNEYINCHLSSPTA